MKKIFIVFILSFLFINVNYVYSSVPNYQYLPGGKNYIDVLNHRQNGYYIETINPFRIKSSSEYTLYLPNMLFDSGDEVEIYFYDINGDEIKSLFFDDVSTLTQINDGHSIPIVTTPDTYKIKLIFYCMQGAYYDYYGVDYIQLEEGRDVTIYESYIAPTLFDINGPELTGTGIVVTSVEDPITVGEIKSLLSAVDDHDGDVTNRIVVETDNYSINEDVLGLYDIHFTVSDLSDNKTTGIVKVNVVDITKPIITGTDSFNSPQSSPLTLDFIKSQLYASDNYDGDISIKIILESDNFSINNTIVGSYNLEYSVTDNSGNSYNKTITVNVIDDVIPIISGIDSISKAYNNTLTIEQIKSYLSAVDAVDGDVTSSIVVDSDSYSSNSNSVGSYDVVFKATDVNSNTAFHTVTVNVFDDIPPVLYVNDLIVTIEEGTVLDLDQLTSILLASGELDKNTDYAIKILYDSYSGFEDTPGHYAVKLRFLSADGENYDKNFEITVLESNSDDYLHYNGEKTIYEKIGDWFLHRYDSLYYSLIDIFLILFGLVIGCLVKFHKRN